MTERPHHRPLWPGAGFFDGLEAGLDPALVREAADRAATILVRGAHETGGAEIAERVVHLAETEGLETLAELWAGSPAESLAGSLWRLYLLRSWVYADPVGLARAFETGQGRAQVDRVVSGVAEPPGPAELKDMVDGVLRGVVESDFADVLLRASAFARVVATGRAATPEVPGREALRTLTLAEQLERAARLEMSDGLA